jgi:hypothetical protein
VRLRAVCRASVATVVDEMEAALARGYGAGAARSDRPYGQGESLGPVWAGTRMVYETAALSTELRGRARLA